MLHRFAGETIATSLDLGLNVAAATATPDVVVTVEHVAQIEHPGIDTVLHRGMLDGAPWKLASLPDSGGWLMELGLGCMAIVNSDGTQITVQALPEAPEEWLSEVVTTWALVYRLAVNERPTFHASAAAIDPNRAIAICGAGFSGKSTMAAAVCALGGQLLSDDVLAVNFPSTGQPVVWSTAASVKLRGVSGELNEHLDGDTSTTFDDRLRVAQVSSLDAAPIERLVFLEPDAAPELTAISPGQATVKLLNNSKVGMWDWDSARDREFEAACELAERVPGFVIGREPEPATAASLLRAARRLVDF